jgi:hypothetical protein
MRLEINVLKGIETSSDLAIIMMNLYEIFNTTKIYKYASNCSIKVEK